VSHYIFIFSLLFLVSCSSTIPAKPLKSTYWSLIELHDDESCDIDHQPPVHLFFHINDNTLHGNDGCNTIRASYTQTDKAFSFTHITSSKMVCAEGIEQADEFLQVLQETNRLIINEDEMFLYHNEQQIARFKAKGDY